MLEARVDFLTMRLEQLHERLLLRASELEKTPDWERSPSGHAWQRSIPEPHDEAARRMVAAEFREIAGVLE